MFDVYREVHSNTYNLRSVYLAAPGAAARGVDEGEEGAELVKHLDNGTVLK